MFVVDRPGVNRNISIPIFFKRMLFMIFNGKSLQATIFKQGGGGGTGKYQIELISYSISYLRKFVKFLKRIQV